MTKEYKGFYKWFKKQPNYKKLYEEEVKKNQEQADIIKTSYATVGKLEGIIYGLEFKIAGIKKRSRITLDRKTSMFRRKKQMDTKTMVDAIKRILGDL
jgi:hypothetical protein